MKRRACAFCKKRKLRCDRETPCASCQKFGFECQYNMQDVAKREFPKVSRVSRLENRLGKVEDLLESTGQNVRQPESSRISFLPNLGNKDDLSGLNTGTMVLLEQGYFDYIHPVINIIHQQTYTDIVRYSRDDVPLHLRYAIAALGSLKCEANSYWSERLYHASRKCLQEIELDDDQLDRVALAQCQSWVLISAYELHQGYFHRAWMSTARAVRSVQFLRLHQVDSRSCHRDPTLNLVNMATNIIEAEQRRRLFWQTFLMDRYCSVSNESPPLIQESDVQATSLDHLPKLMSRQICIFLPVSDDAFARGVEEEHLYLQDLKHSRAGPKLSSFAASVVRLSMSVESLVDIDRFDLETSHDDPAQVRLQMKNFQQALSTDYRVPPHFDLAISLLEPSLAYLHTATATATIAVHRAAKLRNPRTIISPDIVKQSDATCLEAAFHIQLIMEITSDWNIHSYHFLTLYSLYSAVAIFASFWLLEAQPTYEKSMAFLIDKLELASHSIRLARILLQDIDNEFPALRKSLQTQTKAAEVSNCVTASITTIPHSTSGMSLYGDVTHIMDTGIFHNTELWSIREDPMDDSFFS